MGAEDNPTHTHTRILLHHGHTNHENKGIGSRVVLIVRVNIPLLLGFAPPPHPAMSRIFLNGFLRSRLGDFVTTKWWPQLLFADSTNCVDFIHFINYINFINFTNCLNSFNCINSLISLIP